MGLHFPISRKALPSFFKVLHDRQSTSFARYPRESEIVKERNFALRLPLKNET